MCFSKVFPGKKAVTILAWIECVVLGPSACYNQCTCCLFCLCGCGYCLDPVLILGFPKGPIECLYIISFPSCVGLSSSEHRKSLTSCWQTRVGGSEEVQAEGRESFCRYVLGVNLHTGLPPCCLHLPIQCDKSM